MTAVSLGSASSARFSDASRCFVARSVKVKDTNTIAPLRWPWFTILRRLNFVCCGRYRVEGEWITIRELGGNVNQLHLNTKRLWSLKTLISFWYCVNLFLNFYLEPLNGTGRSLASTARSCSRPQIPQLVIAYNQRSPTIPRDVQINHFACIDRISSKSDKTVTSSAGTCRAARCSPTENFDVYR